MVERIIAAEDKGNKEKCAACKADLEDINRSNDNCPIVLNNMTFKMFYIIFQLKRVKSPWNTSLIPSMVGS